MPPKAGTQPGCRILDPDLRRGERSVSVKDGGTTEFSPADPERHLVDALAALLVESFRLWQADAQVEPGTNGTDLLVEGAGPRLVIRRRAGDDLFGWEMEDRSGWAAQPARPCASVLGVLSAVRRALGAEAVSAPRLRAGFMEAAP